MTTYNLKTRFQALLRPVLVILHSVGITPNQLTIFTCLASVFVGVLINLSEANIFWIMPVFLFIRMAFNALDGMLATQYNLRSPIGAILNEVTDVIADGFLYYAFIKLSFISSHLLLAVIFLSSVTEVCGLSALLNQKARQYSGPMGKSDRALAFGILAIFVASGVDNQLIYQIYLGLVLLLLLKTLYNRIMRGI